jgi:saccharopine dehydrogenase-like NADP-dependent oxidoreductase
VDGQPVIPRHVLHALWEPQIRGDENTRDLIIIRILAKGTKAGRPIEAWVDLIHYADAETGFTAMEQGTGWHASILAAAIAAGRVPKGVIPVEQAMTGKDFVAEAERRGFRVDLRVGASS